MSQQTSTVAAITLPRALQVRIRDEGEIPTSVSLSMVETTASILVVTGVRQLARRCFEGLQVESEELVFLEVGQLVGMRPKAIIRVLAVGLAG